MLETVISESKLHFAVKDLSISSVKKMLEQDGWTSEN